MELTIKNLSVIVVMFTICCRCNCIQRIVFNRRLPADSFTTLFDVSLHECSKQCLARLKCLSVSYKRRFRLCSLHEKDSSSYQLVKRRGNVYIGKGNMDTTIMPFVCSPACSSEEACELLDGAPTCVIRECPSPGSISSTQFIGNRRHIGSQVYYTCKDGYTLLPSIISPIKTSTCQPNGAWTFVNIACQFTAVDCGPLIIPANGQVQIQSPGGTLEGAVATFTCTYNVLSGSLQRTCLANGQWSGSNVVCTVCPWLASPVNGHVAHTGANFGSTAVYTCNTGYAGNTAGTRTCQNDGSWSGVEAVCTAVDCGIPLIMTANGQVQFSGGTLFGAVATYTCSTGYLITSGSAQRTCSDNGEWNGTDVVCTVDCGPPPSAVNSQVTTVGGTTVGATATYTCDTGYGLTAGSAQRTCDASRVWSGILAVCTVINCGNPPVIANGEVQYLGGTLVNAVATYTCNTGYLITSGPAQRTCGANGQWTAMSILCVADCGPPPSAVNSQVTTDGTTVGATATYTCDTGYAVSAGSAQRTCDANGVWAGTLTVCIKITCPALTNPDNGAVVTSGGWFYGSNAFYSCDSGYSGPTPGTRTCTSTGSWNGTAVVCNSGCGTPPTLENGFISLLTGTEAGDEVLYMCNTGYYDDTGSTMVLTCGVDGTWSGTLPTCRIVDCGAPYQNAGTYVDAPDTTYQKMANYSCFEGYEVEWGNAERECMQWGAWSGYALRCGLFDPPCDTVGTIDTMLTNVALHKPVTMSSQFNSAASPSLLVDGSHGNNGPFASTTHETTPWMQIDLQAVYTISAIRVFNRYDCCTASLTDIRIYLGDGTTMTHRAVGYDAIIHTMCKFAIVPFQASHVKIQKLGNGYFTIDEMEVFA